jgi:hypothetical protein
MFTGRLGSRRDHPKSWYAWGIRAVAAMATIALLIVVVSHKDSQFPKAKNCPSAPEVNAALGTHVASPTAVSESDLLGCFYPEGEDGQAVSVSFATPTLLDDPCSKRPRLEVSGAEACNVTGTPGTKKSGASLVVETAKIQDQFTTDLPRITLDRLEGLAVKVLAAPPPPLHDSGSSL